MIALYHEHEKGIELLVSVHDGDEVARIAVGEHLRRRGEEGREERACQLRLPSLLFPCTLLHPECYDKRECTHIDHISDGRLE